MAPKSKKSAQKTTLDAAPTPSPPDWPVLAPLPHPDDLALSSLLENQIITISNLWPSSLCKKYVNFLSGLPLVTTPGVPKRGDAVRVNDRFQVEDELFAQRLWNETGLKSLVTNAIVDGKALSEGEKAALWGGHVLGLNKNIRIYRYKKGQFFDQHYDESNNVDFDGIPARTTWTLLLYLSSPLTGCLGGETVFYQDPQSRRAVPLPPIIAEPAVGMCLLHRHGADCLIHEGREVLEGEKWVVRSDLCVRR